MEDLIKDVKVYENTFKPTWSRLKFSVREGL